MHCNIADFHRVPVVPWRVWRVLGATMMKHCRKSKPKSRFVCVTAEGDAISWSSRKRTNNTSPFSTVSLSCLPFLARDSDCKRIFLCTVPFSSIVRVQRGRHTHTFHRTRSSSIVSSAWSPGLPPEDDCSFSIICDEHSVQGRLSLDLVAASQEQCEFWWVRFSSCSCSRPHHPAFIFVS